MEVRVINSLIPFSNTASPLAILNYVNASGLIRTSDRQCPSIATNDRGWLIQTYKHHKNRTSYYRIGEINEARDNIEWHGEDHQYDSGKSSKICLNDDGLIVEVSESNHGHRCFYKVGKLNTVDKKIEWMSEQDVFASGENPAVALNSKGIAVVAYEKGRLQKDLYYRVGDMDERNGVINWRNEETKLLSNCWHVSVTLNSKNAVVFSFTSTSCHSFVIGYVNPDHDSRLTTNAAPESSNALIINPISDASTRSSGQHLPDKYHTVVGVNNFGHLVSARTIRTNVSFFNGRLGHNHNITESSLRRSGDRLLNTSYNVLSSSISVNGRNSVAFTCHIAHGFLNRQKIVFTTLGKLVPCYKEVKDD